ncbi:MAG: WG repeat-containing protein, partial [Saprospiraceae bacterium]
DSSHWRLIDAAGNTVTDLAGAGVHNAGRVQEGRCWFANSAGGYGYLDGAGRVVVKPTFQRTFNFSGGRARAVADQTTGLIDTAGNWVLPPGEFLRIEDFDPVSGLAAAQPKSRRGKVLLDRDGREVTPLYTALRPAGEGYFAFKDGLRYGLLDTTGAILLRDRYAVIGPVSERVVQVKERADGRWSLIDLRAGGKPFLPETFDRVDPFCEGYLLVQERGDEPETRYLVDRNGRRLPGGGPDLLLVGGGGFAARLDPTDRDLQY